MRKQLTTEQYWRIRALNAEQLEEKERLRGMHRLRVMLAHASSIEKTCDELLAGIAEAQKAQLESTGKALQDCIFELGIEHGLKGNQEAYEVTIGTSPETSFIHDEGDKPAEG